VSVVAIDEMSVKAVGEAPTENEVAAVTITPDGKYVVASHTGARGINADAEVIIDPAGAHPHVANIMAPGTGVEAFAISPNGKWAVTPLIEGPSAPPTAWNHTKGGHAALMAVGPGGKLTVVSKAPIGALPEGVVFSPNSEYVYIGNYIDKNMQIFRISAGKLVATGTVALPGQPASMRGVAR
jgi:6-phosphogluconolactonase (cycloisomerase 2 family)